MISLWHDSSPVLEPIAQVLDAGHEYDVVIVGAGLVGLATAHMLTKSGLSVAVVEAHRAGAGATGNSTAKLSLLHSGIMAELRSHTSTEVLRAYMDGNRAGQTWLLEYLAHAGVPVQTRDAISYTAQRDGVNAVTAEREAAVAAGLAVVDAGTLPLPFPVYAAIRLERQAQFDPMQVIRALVADVRDGGGVVVEDTRVVDVRPGDLSTVETTAGTVTARHVILATGVPILDRGLYFAKTEPRRSYALAFRVPGAELPPDMYLSLDTPTHSLRMTPVADGDRLLVGGNGHVVGRDRSTQRNVDDLELWTLRHFPTAVRTHAWSAQDYTSANRIPFVGTMPRTGGHVSVATGFNKWGMSNAIAAALSLSADVLGGSLPWAEKLHHRVTRPRGLAFGGRFGLGVARELARGWGGAVLRRPRTLVPGDGDGVVGLDGLVPTAVSNVGGEVHELCAICPHLGGIVTWNRAEQSWDCPLHGSRFDHEGHLIEGPATSDLRRR